MLNPDLNASDNRMAAGQGWSFDAAGNVIADPQGRLFIYDAENKQVLVSDQWSVVSGQYVFDGDANGSKKSVLSQRQALANRLGL